MLTQKTTNKWILSLVFTLYAGISAASAAMDFDTIIAKTKEFVAATEAVEEENKGIEKDEDKKALPEWSDYVPDDANTTWSTISDAVGDEEGGDAAKEQLKKT